MDDNRIWAFEDSLWKATPEHYAESLDEQYLCVIPNPPFVAMGAQAVDVLSATPRWDSVEFSETHVARPQEGLIVIAYRAKAKRGDEVYDARCSSTYRWLSHENWRVVQHQQTPVMAD